MTRRSISPAEDGGPDPTEGWLVAQGARLHTLLWTPPADAGVLVVHGFGDHARRYRDVVGVLGSHGYATMAYDLRGHGESDGPRGHASSFSLYLDDLDLAWAEAERVLPGGVPFLYAHSFGGLVAIRWLQTRATRPRGVVLSAPWLETALRVPAWKRLAARLLLRVAPALAISSGSNRPENLTRDPERAAEYASDPLVHHRISAGLHAEIVRAQAAARSAGLPAGLPALVVVPGDDSLVDAEATLAWVRTWGEGGSVRVRNGGRHELHNDIDRAEALAGITDWLDTVAGRTRGGGEGIPSAKRRERDTNASEGG